MLVILAIAPWLKVAFSNVPKAGAFWNTIPDYGAFCWHTNILCGNETLFYVFNGLVICSLILFLINIKYKLFKDNFNPRYYFLFLSLYIFPIVLDFAVSQYTPVFLTRYFLYSTFGLFLLVAYCFAFLRINNALRILLFLPLILFLFSSFKITQPREDDWKHIIPIVKKEQNKNSVIIISSSYKYKDFAFYYDKNAFDNYNKCIDMLAKDNVYSNAVGEWFNWKNLNYDSVDKIIYVQAHSFMEDPENKNREYFHSKGFIECDYFRNSNIQYTVFIRNTIPCFPLKTISGNKNNPCDVFEKYETLNSNNDTVENYNTSFEYAETCNITQGITNQTYFTGKHSMKVGEENQFSLGIFKPAREFLNGKKRMTVIANLNMEEGNEGHLVVSVEKGDATLYRNDIFLKEKYTTMNKWQRITFSSLLPEYISHRATIKIYFWNPAKQNIFVDDLTVLVY